MAKKHPLHEFIRLFSPGVQYSRGEIKTIAKTNGYIIPGEFWETYKVGRGKYGVTKKAKTTGKDWKKDDFTVTITTHYEFLNVVEVKHIETGNHGLTSCEKNSIEEKTEILMETLSPWPVVVVDTEEE